MPDTLGTSTVGAGMRVLIVDDDRDTTMTLGILLRSEGFHVRLLQDSRAVRKAVTEFEPDAVLLDLGMPERNGYEVAQELTRQYGPLCPVLIAVTAHNSDTQRRATEACGFRHHVAKPYDPVELLSLLATLIRQR